mmetsp:Transcript_33500/g.77260  ORF Transcript_33500/g.77260 Transcript_33500/m.77260 type:complete len:331 (+) Transcript_33500:52-1044(+)
MKILVIIYLVYILSIENIHRFLADNSSFYKTILEYRHESDDERKNDSIRRFLHLHHGVDARHLYDGEQIGHLFRHDRGPPPLRRDRRVLKQAPDPVPELQPLQGGEPEVQKDPAERRQGHLRQQRARRGQEHAPADERVYGEPGDPVLERARDVAVPVRYREGADVGGAPRRRAGHPGEAQGGGGRGEEGEHEHVAVHPVQQAVRVAAFDLSVAGVVDQTGRDVLVEEEEDGGERRRKTGRPARPDREVQQWDEPGPSGGGGKLGGKGQRRKRRSGGSVFETGGTGYEGSDGDADGRREIGEVVSNPLGKVGGFIAPFEDNRRDERDAGA